MAIIRVPWKKQPQVAVKINRGNLLTQGLTFVYLPGVPEIIRGRMPTTQVGSIGAGTRGRSVAFDRSSAKVWYDGAVYAAAGPHSVFSLVTITSLASDQGILSKNSANMIPLNHGIENTTGRIFDYTYDTSSGARDAYWTSDVLTLAVGETATVGIDTDGYLQNPPRFYKNGIFETGTLRSGAFEQRLPQEVTDVPLAVGAYSAGSGFFSGSIYLVCRWNRRLSESEFKSLHADPWQLFAPRRVYVPPPGAAPSLPTLSASTYVTGSLTSTGWRPQVTAS
jgi:hypothetical protein